MMTPRKLHTVHLYKKMRVVYRDIEAENAEDAIRAALALEPGDAYETLDCEDNADEATVDDAATGEEIGYFTIEDTGAIKQQH